jgi:hypothetical protein
MKINKYVSVWDVVKVILIFLMFAVPFALYFIDIPSPKKDPIDSDTALEYLHELEYYVEESGDTDIYLYFLEHMEENPPEEYEERMTESYNAGYQDAFNEALDKEHNIIGQSYQDGYVIGYSVGYSDKSSHLPYDDSVERQTNEDYDMYLEERE